MVRRTDRTGKLKSKTRTPNGGVVLDCFFSRTGVLKYKLENGKIRRELRLPEEVFSKQSLDSLAHIAVTRDHPNTMVDEYNYDRHAIGHTFEPGTRVPGDGGVDFLAGRVVLTKADAIKDVEEGKLSELSLGYWCDLEWVAGTYNGEAYDCIQRNITQNHVAAGGTNYGRAGENCRLHTDAGDDFDGYAYDVTHNDSGTVTERQDVMKIIINGVEYEYGSAAHIDAVEKPYKARISELEGKLVAAQSNGVLGTAERTELDTLRKDKASRDRADVFTKAKALGFTCDAKALAATPAIDIIREVLAQSHPEIPLEGRDESFIMGAFYALNPPAAGAQSITAAGATGGQTLATDARTAIRRDGADSGSNDQGNGSRTSLSIRRDGLRDALKQQQNNVLGAQFGKQSPSN